MTTRSRDRKPVWKRRRPSKAPHRTLTSAQKKRARADARRGGRRYPNLVDNIRASRQGPKPRRLGR